MMTIWVMETLLVLCNNEYEDMKMKENKGRGRHAYQPMPT